jgi:hypothetical protein
MTLNNDIEQFQRDLNSCLETTENLYRFCDQIQDSPEDELSCLFRQLQALCEELDRKLSQTGDCLLEINRNWGNATIKHYSSLNQTTSTSISSRSTINPTVSPAIHFTQGGHKDYLERHYWDSQDGKVMQQYRENLTTKEKQFISQVQGESWGHFYVTDVLGYEEVFHGDSKSIRQGLDGIYLDTKKNDLVVIEFKGQKSLESKIQQQPTWTLDTCQKIQRYQPPYNNVSEFERDAAVIILKEYEAGRTIRYEVVRTEVDSSTGKMWTQLEKRTHLEAGNFTM